MELQGLVPADAVPSDVGSPPDTAASPNARGFLPLPVSDTAEATVPVVTVLPAGTAPTAAAAADDADATAPPPARWMVIGAWASLFVAVFSMSAIGPTFKWLQEKHVPPLLAAVWRGQCVLLFLVPPTILEYARTPRDERCKWREPRPDRWAIHWYVLLNGIGWAVSLSLWVVALQYTTTVRASLFCSLYPLVLVVYYRCRGVHVSRGEVAGVLIALLGIILTVVISLVTADGDANEGHSTTDLLLGDGLCVITSLASALDVVVSYYGRSVLPLFVYTTANQLIVTSLVTLFSVALEGASFSAAAPPDGGAGLFGWATAEWVVVILALGFVVGCVGLLGFNIAVKYINPLVFSVVQLLDPLLTGLFAWLIGLEGVPGVGTWTGGAVLCVGVVLVGVSEARRTEREQREEKEAKARKQQQPTLAQTPNDPAGAPDTELSGIASPTAYAPVSPTEPAAATTA